MIDNLYARLLPYYDLTKALAHRSTPVLLFQQHPVFCIIYTSKHFPVQLNESEDLLVLPSPEKC